MALQDMLALAVMDTVGSNVAFSLDSRYIYHEILYKAYPKIKDVELLLENNRKLSCGKEDYRLTIFNESDKTPLQIACNQADTIDPLIVNRLVESSPESVMLSNSMGLLPLHYVFLNNKKPNVSIVETLIGANSKCLMQTNKQGLLPIHIALSYPRAYDMLIYELLLSPDRDPYEQLMTQDNYGHTPLHKAISNKKINDNVDLFVMLFKLCDAGAHVKDKDGNLPLHWYVSSKDGKLNLGMLKLLFQYYPGSVLIGDNTGQVALSKYMSRVGADRDSLNALLQQKMLIKSNPQLLLDDFHHNDMNSDSSKPEHSPNSRRYTTAMGNASTSENIKSLNSNSIDTFSLTSAKNQGDSVSSSNPSSVGISENEAQFACIYKKSNKVSKHVNKGSRRQTAF